MEPPGLLTEWSSPIDRRGTSGEAFVLIHGFSGHPGHWLPTAESLLARRHTVVAPRLAGHGTSPQDLAATRWKQWMASARRAAESVADHRRVHLVGLSMGGMLAILLARETAAFSLTTINTPVLVRDARVMLAPALHRMIVSTPASVLTSPDPALAHLWTPYEVNPTVAVAELVKVVCRGWRRAREIRRPSVVMQSRSDEAVLPISGWLLARRLDAEMVWLANSRHNAILDPSRSVVAATILRHADP